MTPQQKAEYMISNYTGLFGSQRAKEEALKEAQHHLVHNPGSAYWQEVKAEIESHGKELDNQ